MDLILITFMLSTTWPNLFFQLPKGGDFCFLLDRNSLGQTSLSKTPLNFIDLDILDWGKSH